jgi:hypothetical protein
MELNIKMELPEKASILLAEFSFNTQQSIGITLISSFLYRHLLSISLSLTNLIFQMQTIFSKMPVAVLVIQPNSLIGKPNGH